MLPVSSRLKIITLLLLLLTLFLAPQLAANVEAGYVPDPSHWPAECVIPDSGPWPPCATGGESAPPANGDCVIPATGPWPPCATGGQTPGGDCVIPASGPWPPCATGGKAPPTGSGDCVIPTSGPWPPCATGGGGGSTPIAAPKLISFSADKSWVRLDDVVKLSWNVANADRVSLRPMDPSQPLYTIDGLPGVVESYEFDMQNLCDGDGEVEFELLVLQNNKYQVIGSLKIASQVNGWFFTLSDGTTPASQPCNVPTASHVAVQSFENGYMLWLADTDGIYVMFNGEGSTPPTWIERPNMFEEGMPESDPALVPPDGLYQPVRGFGKMWRESLEIREALGWATNPEVGYTATYQWNYSCGATYCSTSTFISDPSGEMLWSLYNTGSHSQYPRGWSYQAFTWAK